MAAPIQLPELQMLLDVAPDAFVVTREDGEILLVNAQTERLFGLAGDELLGQPVDISLGPIEIGGETLVVAAIRDATQRKRLEEAAHRLEQEELRRRQALERGDLVRSRPALIERD